MLGTSPYPQPITSPFQSLPNGTPTAQQPAIDTGSMEPKEANLPRYVNYLADYSGCGHWRILWPEAVINARGDGMSQSTTAMVNNPAWYTKVNAVKLQRQASSMQKEFIKFLKHVQQEHGFKIIYEVDDVVLERLFLIIINLSSRLILKK